MSEKNREKRTKWLSSPPLLCHLCSRQIKGVFVDARVPGATSWAIMCPMCASWLKVDYGVGFGQMYAQAEDGNYYKLKG